MKVGDGIDRSVGPRQLFLFQIELTEVAPGRTFIGRASYINSEESQIRVQLSDVEKGFAIRCAQIEKCAISGRGCDKTRTGVKPWKESQVRPVHLTRVPL